MKKKKIRSSGKKNIFEILVTVTRRKEITEGT
jgi:hypothetical protein